jgi:hypothetical protein
MSSMETLQKELGELKENRDGLNGKIRDKLLALAECCPVKTGEKVVVNGWTYRGQQIIVDSIKYEERNGYGRNPDTHWKCEGYVLKKDGAEGKNRAEHLC